MKAILVLTMVGLLCGAGPETQPATRPTTQPAGPPPQVKAAMAELWRRGFCLLSEVYEPAEKQTAVPKDLGPVPVVTPRVIGRQGSLLCYATDRRSIWSADDLGLYQVDSTTAKPTRRLDWPDLARAGLDQPIQDIALAGTDVWLATREGLAHLDASSGKLESVDAVRFALARLAVGGGRVWVFSDAGAWMTPIGQRQWRKLADCPALESLAGVSRRGFWSAVWMDRLRTLIPSMVATEDGLFVVCLNRALAYDPSRDEWTTLGEQAWQVLAGGRIVWVLTTGGVVCFEPASGRKDRFAAGAGPAAGRPVAMAATRDALLLVSQPDYDAKQGRFVGGGVSRFDLASRTWTVTDQIDGVDVRFCTTLLADGDEAWVACKLYDRVIQLGAHPGMAHVKKWVPHACGLGLAHFKAGRWNLLKAENLKTHSRWVMGQKGTLREDKVGPDTVEHLCRSGSSVAGVYRIVPDSWYSGYFMSVGFLARQNAQTWSGRFDARTDELGLGGEQPELMLLSASHGPEIVLAEGHPDVLGLEDAGGQLWAVCQNGVFRHEPDKDRCIPVVEEDYRAYWAVTSALADADAVWFGGDGGTVSRFDRRTGRFELKGIAPGRKVVSLSPGQLERSLEVKTAKAEVCLPARLVSASRLPDEDSIVLEDVLSPDGRLPAKTTLACKGNFLCRGDSKLAFLKGVFRPRVLCEDRFAGKVWLATYDGLAVLPLPPDPAASKPDE